jgi:hypothetical protein
MESDSSSSEYSDSDIASMWTHNKPRSTKKQHKLRKRNGAKSASPVICPSGSQNLTFAQALLKNVVSISQKTHFISITETIHLMPFREIVAVYSENCKHLKIGKVVPVLN